MGAAMGVLAANAAVAAGLLLAGIAFLLFATGLVAWRRVGHLRLMWVALAFLGLCAQGVLLAWNAYQKRAEIAAGAPVSPPAPPPGRRRLAAGGAGGPPHRPWGGAPAGGGYPPGPLRPFFVGRPGGPLRGGVAGLGPAGRAQAEGA